MSEFMKLAIVFISMLVLFYFLWVNGYMILNAKRALLFVVSLRGKNKCEVSFSSCSGYVKKVIKECSQIVDSQKWYIDNPPSLEKIKENNPSLFTAVKRLFFKICENKK